MRVLTLIDEKTSFLRAGNAEKGDMSCSGDQSPVARNSDANVVKFSHGPSAPQRASLFDSGAISPLASAFVLVAVQRRSSL